MLVTMISMNECGNDTVRRFNDSCDNEIDDNYNHLYHEEHASAKQGSCQCSQAKRFSCYVSAMMPCNSCARQGSGASLELHKILSRGRLACPRFYPMSVHMNVYAAFICIVHTMDER